MMVSAHASFQSTDAVVVVPARDRLGDDRIVEESVERSGMADA